MKTNSKYSHKDCQNAVISARDVYHKVWLSACQYDDIPINSKFVVFSDSNPFVYYVNKAYQELISRISEYQNGGYVGLVISGCSKKERQIQKEQAKQQKIDKFIKIREQLQSLEKDLQCQI